MKKQLNKKLNKKPTTSKEVIDEKAALYRELFESDIGKMVLEDLRKDLRFGETLYSKGQENKDLLYLIGRQSVYNDILFKMKRNV